LTTFYQKVKIQDVKFSPIVATGYRKNLCDYFPGRGSIASARHCHRQCRWWDCFASLAMTVKMRLFFGLPFFLLKRKVARGCVNFCRYWQKKVTLVEHLFFWH